MEKFIGFLKMNKLKVSKEGFSLVEVLVAMLVLLILVVAFTQLLSWSFSTIFNEGRKSQAIATAMEETDKLTTIIWNAENPITSLENIDECVSSADLLKDRSKEWVFCYKQYASENPKQIIENGATKNVLGYDIAVVVFYEQGKYYVKLESFIKDVG